MTSTAFGPSKQAVYDAVGEFCAENGYSPSVREICAMVGLSEATVHVHIRRLVREGRLTQKDNSPRTLRVA